jgi:hypothetical protein
MDADLRGGKSDPDPSPLTTAALLREIDQLHNLVRGWVDALQVLMEAQLKGVVANIETRLNGNDTALQAALQAAEKAVAKQNDSFAIATKKSEDALFKQIDQLGVLINTANKGLEDKINDVRDRMTRFEGSVQGKSSSASDSREDSRNMIAAVAVIVALVMGGLGFLFGHTSSPSPVPTGIVSRP